ncbi:hypothetical protein BCR36DRAFT_356256 [Piromyces finnis]|uniref:F-box domain-containing protein n=1 Tax=Piromyces finnis TaxID=1754191 RepID=A0A1Y1V629_9FUNG|nr:hypothetical protein BCR36DRAFT_356256 [Piromyces finnis]|eukprot:ORX46863.1 hypothetical protein BCR36DRAFT_356256 [Piromyces finnis]
MDNFEKNYTILPVEITLRIFSFLDLTELVELSKINSYYKNLTKIAYIERVINSRLIMEIHLGTEQPINIRYECSKFNRNTEQTTWKPTAIIGSKNRRSVNTKEKIILKRIYFENEPKMTEKDNYNLIHLVKGGMDIKDSGIECIKGEEKLVELHKKLKKNLKNKRKLNLFKIKNKSYKSEKNNFLSKKSFNKEEKINTEFYSDVPIIPNGSVKSVDSISSYLTKHCDDGYMINNQCLYFFDCDELIRDTIKWSFEYKVESVSKGEGETLQKLQPSKLRLPINIFFQNKQDIVSNSKNHNYSKYKAIVKKNMLSILVRFSASAINPI